MIIPQNNHILVKVIKLTETKSGLANTKENQAQEYGEVIHAGDTKYNKGDMVYFKSYSATPITVENVEHIFVRADEVVGIQSKR